ncbi:hypothetical protein EYF80_019714 [Liparis tanakae]|uniref:Uncharacterized protein n=1 Tax=Liparis tanakae TaxID=230148 RepID=A0A4Z2HWI4_9TELE|nr:hypothetical protein EYF80_019714 [Liparis tanakae]
MKLSRTISSCAKSNESQTVVGCFCFVLRGFCQHDLGGVRSERLEVFQLQANNKHRGGKRFTVSCEVLSLMSFSQVGLPCVSLK